MGAESRVRPVGSKRSPRFPAGMESSSTEEREARRDDVPLSRLTRAVQLFIVVLCATRVGTDVHSGILGFESWLALATGGFVAILALRQLWQELVSPD